MKNTILVLLLFWGIGVKGQQWKNYTNSETVICVAADHDTLWVGTQGGVAKYLTDGTKLANYTHADGLACNYVHGIAIDQNGNKWFATGIDPGSGDSGGGVSKFDGTTWTTYDTTNSGISSSTLTGVVIDNQNHVWVSTYGRGLTKFDGFSWTNYDISNSILPSNSVGNLMLDKLGNVWMFCYSYNSSGNFVKINGSNWSIITKPNGIGAASMAFDNQNNLWTAWTITSPGTQPGVAKFDGSNWTTISTSMNCTAIAVDAQNNKWFCSGSYLYKFDDVNWTSYTTPITGISLSYFLFIDSSDSKWFAAQIKLYPSLASGLGRFDGTNWNLYKPSSGKMPGNSVYTLAADHHGNKWISAFSVSGCGLVKFDGTANWDSISTGYPDVSMVDRNDRIWFGTYYFDGTNWNSLSNPYNISPNSIAEDNQNNKWFGTNWGGAYRFDGTNWTAYDSANSGLANNTIWAIAVDSQGNKWFGTSRGVSKFDGVNWTTYTSSNSGLADNLVYAVAIDLQGNKWFGSPKGVSKFDGTNWTTYNELNSGLAGNEVYEIAVDKAGAKWFATRSSVTYRYKGVTKFDGNNWTTYTTFNSGISSNRIISIVVDDWNNKWFTSGEGVSELRDDDSSFTVWAQFSGNICSSNTITLNPVLNYGTPPYTFSWQSIGNSLSCSNCQNPTATITQNSVFIVSVTDSNNLTTADTLHVYYCGYTGISETKNLKDDFSIFPNPATNRLNIDTRGMEILAVRIYSSTGQLMLETKPLQNESVDISKLVPGIYIAEIKTKEKSVMKRWVKM
jgi:ligand-binding sensor domain-containing protein